MRPIDKAAVQNGLYALGCALQENKRDKGFKVTTPALWEDDNQVPADLCLIHSEVSEALEAFREDDRDAFKEELADIVMRVVGLAHGLEIDLGDAILTKLAIIKARPHKHGGKRI